MAYLSFSSFLEVHLTNESYILKDRIHFCSPSIHTKIEPDSEETWNDT